MILSLDADFLLNEPVASFSFSSRDKIQWKMMEIRVKKITWKY